MTEKKAGTCHSGHRERMRRRFIRDGLDHFAPHEVLELILMYAIPRQDTNVIAHRLIDRFHTLSGVLDASEAELMSVPGIGERSAALIRLFVPVLRRYLTEEEAERPILSDCAVLGGWLIRFFTGIPQEITAVLTLDGSFRLIACDVLDGATNSAAVIGESIAECVFRHHASSFVLAHNHPFGTSVPSEQDLQLTRSLRDLFSRQNRPMTEHILVSGSTFSALVRDYLEHR